MRLEYKLDLIIRALQQSGAMLGELPGLEGIEKDCCPICETPVRVIADMETETPLYTCECRSPKVIVTGISALVPPRSHDVYADRNPEEEVPHERTPPGDRDS
jgi:hypothetical protein